jgi:hypothetical protein
MDGEMTIKVFELLFANQKLIHEASQTLKMNVQGGLSFASEKLDFAFLYFFQMFRKSYIGESKASTDSQATKLFVDPKFTSNWTKVSL